MYLSLNRQQQNVIYLLNLCSLSRLGIGGNFWALFYVLSVVSQHSILLVFRQFSESLEYFLCVMDLHAVVVVSGLEVVSSSACIGLCIVVVSCCKLARPS